MITASVDMTGFNAGIVALMRSVGATSRVIVEKETGELIKTLVRISPPENPGKTKASILNKHQKMFATLGENNNYEYDSTKSGSGGMKWYASSKKYLFGSSPQNDMRKADTRELLNLSYRVKNIQGSGRIISGFKRRMTNQRVAIITKIVAKPSQVKKLISKIQGHVGRLKAGWMVAARDGKVKITGAYLPPSWVKKHSVGAMGRAEVQLSDATNPSITITNFAKGVTGKKSQYFVNSALKIRAKAMLANAALFTSGKKNLADYAR
jgi:hypothetical protein